MNCGGSAVTGSVPLRRFDDVDEMSCTAMVEHVCSSLQDYVDHDGMAVLR